MKKYFKIFILFTMASCFQKNKDKNDVNTSEVGSLPDYGFTDTSFDCDSFLNTYPFKSQKNFDIELYNKIYFSDWQCGKKFSTLYYKHHPRTDKDTYTVCNEIQDIDLSDYNKSDFVSLYRDMLKSGNDNCPLELLDKLHKNKSRDKVLIDTLSHHLDGYVAEYYCELFPDKCNELNICIK